MAVYVSLPQIPLALRFEEPAGEVVERFRALITAGQVCCFEVDDGTTVVVNFAVQASAFVSEGFSQTDPDDLHSAVRATLPPNPE